MPRGIRPVWKGRVQEDVQTIRLACSGRVENVTRMLVACDGVAIQVFPPDGSPPVARITLEDNITSQRISDSDATALLALDNASGRVRYTLVGGGEGSNPAYEPSPVAAGTFFAQFVQTSGDPVFGPSGWVDVTTLPLWSITESVRGQSQSAVGTFSIATDNTGANAKTVNVNFYVERLPDETDDNLWTVTPWVLVDTTEDIPAEVRLRGRIVPYADDSFGEGFEGEGINVPVLQQPVGVGISPVAVRVSAVSGDTADITGDALDTWFTLSFVSGTSKEWKLRAETAVVKTAEVLFEFDVGGNIVSKPVTLIAEQTTGAPPTTITVEFGLPGLVQDDTTPGPIARSSLYVSPDGTVGVYNTAFARTDTTWAQEAPFVPLDEASRFEFRVVVESGEGPDNSANVWRSLVLDGSGFTITWDMTAVGDGTSVLYKTGVWRLEVRQKGTSTVIDTMSVNMSALIERSGVGDPEDPGIEP